MLVIFQNADCKLLFTEKIFFSYCSLKSNSSLLINKFLMFIYYIYQIQRFFLQAPIKYFIIIAMNIKVSIFLLLTISATLSQVCPHSHFFNGQRCAPCQANCICSEQNTCASCLSGYTYDSKFQNCLQCPTASSAVKVGCGQCCFQIVSTQFVCSSCPALSNTYLLGGQCIRIIGCNSINSDGLCQSCENGYFLRDGKCILCHSSCLTCIDSTFCTSCTTGFYNGANSNDGICAACPVGCSACTSSSSCTSCLNGFRFSVSTCIACTANCLQCTNAACTQCAIGYALVSGSCYICSTALYGGTAGCTQCTVNGGSIKCSVCSSGYYLSNSATCISCATTFTYSSLCTINGPIQCLNDLSAIIGNRYYLFGGRCVPNSNKCKVMSNANGQCSSCYFEPGNYYKLNNGVCTQCVQTGCSTFNSQCECQSCLPGYQFVNKQCVACQNLNCNICQSNVRSCQVCATRYGLISSACISCSQNVCVNCNGDQSKCVECLVGYYNSQGVCYKCQASCISCISSTVCTSCTAGHVLLSNGRCKSLPTNCVQVGTNGACTKCSYGYQISSGMCVPCSSDLFNLGQCEKFCPSYYAQRKFESILGRFIALALLLLLIIY